MYHNSIHIQIKSNIDSNINFDYNFHIWNDPYLKITSPIQYGELLTKFKNIGFNTIYLKLNDISELDVVYCSYNWSKEFDLFFKAYSKILKNTTFNITFEYGNVGLDGKFIQNNMTSFAGIFFIELEGYINLKEYDIMPVIEGKIFSKGEEFYQMIDDNFIPISTKITSYKDNFEHNFFERYEVQVALRKYKLDSIKDIFK